MPYTFKGLLWLLCGEGRADSSLGSLRQDDPALHCLLLLTAACLPPSTSFSGLHPHPVRLLTLPTPNALP